LAIGFPGLVWKFKVYSNDEIRQGGVWVHTGKSGCSPAKIHLVLSPPVDERVLGYFVLVGLVHCDE